MRNLVLYFISVLKGAKKCAHKRALLNSNEGYCPDCGHYLKKYYYVLRCSACSHKREATRAVFGKCNEIVPESRYCPVCGGMEYYVEKYEKLNIVDISYAIEVKEPCERCIEPTTRVWVEEVTFEDNDIKDLHPQSPAILTAAPDIPRLKELIS